MTFLLSLVVVTLYALPIFTDIIPSGLFGVDILVAIAAAVTATASLAFYILVPKEPTFARALIVYLLFTATSGLLVMKTGDISSPFIALWMLCAFFGGIFAVWGALPIFFATAILVATQYLYHALDANAIAIISLSSVIPMGIGLLIWRNKDQNSDAAKSVKKLANQLSEVANRSEIVINAIGDGVIAIDGQGVVQLINPAAQEILGWGKQDALMLNYKSILQLTDLNDAEFDPTADPVLQVLNTNQQVRSQTLIIKTKSGKKVVSSLVVSPIGALGSGTIAVFRDMTKEKAEEQEQAEFISTASHEMRTPVASIEGYLGLALNPNTAQIDTKARDFIMKAHEAAQHLGRLFQDLLDVSKSEDGRMTNLLKVVDIVPFAETVVQGLNQKAVDKGLVLTFKPTDNSGQRTITPVYFVNQDNDHIREILDNLIENAVKYTPNGEVVVDVSGTDDKVVLSVKDSGLGIPAEDVTHLFQKFYRVDNPDRQQIGGTGLGLYLSRRLAEAMQGRLWVESVHGQGSTFYLELPRIDTQSAEILKQQQVTQAAVVAQATAQRPVTPPAMPPVVTPRPVAPAGQPQSATTDVPVVKAATTVPRGESLSREQIAEHVRRLEALAKETNAAPDQPPNTPPVVPRPLQTPPVVPARSTSVPPAGQRQS